MGTLHVHRTAGILALWLSAIGGCSSNSVTPSEAVDVGQQDASVDIVPMNDVATFDGGFDAERIDDTSEEGVADDAAADATPTDVHVDTGPDATACAADWQCGPTDVICVDAVRTITEPRCVEGFCGDRVSREDVCAAPPVRCDGDTIVISSPRCDLDDRCAIDEVRTTCPADAPCVDGACAGVARPLEAPSFKGVRVTEEDVAAAVEAGAGMGMVGIEWSVWQPALRSPPCTSGWIAYDGACFVTDRDAETTLHALTESEVRTVVSVHGTPEWARASDCPTDAGPTCGPADVADFARFVGYLAWRYRGPSAAGGAQIDEFVIWPSANDSEAFVAGPAGLASTHRRAWVSMVVAAFDAIRVHRPTATIRAALAADIFTERRGADRGDEWLEALDEAAEGRDWHLAVTPDVLDTDTWTFGPEDAPVTTPGTINRVAGWLAARWPDRTPGLLLIDVVFSSTVRFDPAVQSRAVCAAYRQALATPGIDGVVYGAWRDAFDSLELGELFGLTDIYGELRESGALWASMDDPASAQCGFEHGTRVRLQQWREPDGLWWATSRMTTATFQELDAWWMLERESADGRVALYDCFSDTVGHYLTDDPTCGGDEPRGAIGFAHEMSSDGRVPLVRCLDEAGHVRVDDALDCDGDTVLNVLGWGER